MSVKTWGIRRPWSANLSPPTCHRWNWRMPLYDPSCSHMRRTTESWVGPCGKNVSAPPSGQDHHPHHDTSLCLQAVGGEQAQLSLAGQESLHRARFCVDAAWLLLLPWPSEPNPLGSFSTFLPPLLYRFWDRIIVLGLNTWEISLSISNISSSRL